MGLPWSLSWERIHLQCSRPWFDSWGRKFLWRWDRYPLQYYVLQNSTDRGAWQATVQEVTESQTCLSNFHFSFFWWGELKSGMTYVVLLILSLRTISLSWNFNDSTNCFPVQLLSCADSSWPHGLQHIRLLCPSCSPGICSDSCPQNWRCLPCRIFKY